MNFFDKIFGNSNDKYLKELEPLIKKINSLEREFEKIPDIKLKEKTAQFKERIRKGEKLDSILPEAFALTREAAKRTLSQRHFDVQLIGGIVLHQGKIAEMKTGEGKTLAATLPVYLNALTGKGVHVITVNDYLAKRDAVWMGQIYDMLGLTIGCIVHEAAYLYDGEYRGENENEKSEIKNEKRESGGEDKKRDLLGGFKVVESYLKPAARKEAYGADIVYGTNNEFGFDYLKDNMVYDLSEQSQRGFYFAIVDEIDSILIDEARTPLIISAPTDESTEKYYQFAKLIAGLKENEDYTVDEKKKAAAFSAAGQNKIVSVLSRDPWAENDIAVTHQLEAALKAKVFFKKDQNYVVKEGKVIIVDEFTGRLMPGRRWSGGLHQAVEAKEGVNVQQESRTLASVTFQNYFRMYQKLAGMTGTALTSAEEFDKVYGLEVIAVPTNKTMVRRDLPDKIYKSEKGKYRAIIEEVKERNQKGQPVLVGTVSIENNEFLGKLLEREGVPHQILNAKHHEKEGEIIAQAGRLGAVTIATNMAGRGVDIILGGNPVKAQEQEKIIAAGGLCVIGTERHEARRIDNQLRGRAGRQGDPGSSQFFVSLEDDLMRIFGGERIKNFMEKMKIPEDQPIESKMISKAIESSQAKIEGMNFDLRKNVLEYDDIMNKHREVFYKKRAEILKKAQEGKLAKEILRIIKKANFSEEDYQKREKEVGEKNMREIEKLVSLKVLDVFWTEHLENMEHLRDSVNLRAFGQQDPLVEYKRESHKLFKDFLEEVDLTIAGNILKAEIKVDGGKKEKSSFPASVLRKGKRKIGRNEPCPCGSGKKYKKCHGKEN